MCDRLPHAVPIVWLPVYVTVGSFVYPYVRTTSTLIFAYVLSFPKSYQT